MLRSMTARQFHEWVAFSELEPFEQERLEQVISTITQALVNIHRKRGTRAYTLAEVVPLFGDAKRAGKPKKSWKSMFAMAQQLTAESVMAVKTKLKRK